jgi:putative redox protein
MEMDNGRHQVTIDELPADGGEDLGPQPYELLLAALGGCTAITVLMYAKRKQWPVEDVTVTLTHDKVHPRDSDAFTAEEAENAGPNGRLDLIHMKVLITAAGLDDEQYDRLLEIAGRCPVHRTLENRPKIVSELVRVG